MQAPDDPLAPPNSNVFDGQMGMRGYRINKLAQSMRHPENRRAFLADERGHMAKLGLTAAEQELVLKRDWYGLQAAGGNQYALVKLGGALGINLVAQGAQMRGESVEEFLSSRNLHGKIS
jgi:protocatechuate 4,5-dioxygenase alpha subunit